MLNEAKTSRPRPGLRGQGRGQGRSYEAEAEANFWRLRPRTRPKKYQIMITSIRFKINAGKVNKIAEFYSILARKMPDYIIRERDRGQAEAKSLRSRPRPKFWPRGLFGLEVLTSLMDRMMNIVVDYRTPSSCMGRWLKARSEWFQLNGKY